MSVVTVQLGQCGNQIGTQFFSTLYDDSCQLSSSSPYRQVALERFFHQQDPSSSRSRDLQARAVLVDMESKVVQQSLSTAKRERKWVFNEKCVYVEKCGSGNNWANGYLNHAPSAMSAILDKVRQQTECCDYLDGFLILMSVAGGTGSGVGAKVTECLRDAYPHCTLVNSIVWPYPSGEVIVQDYNSLLTTAHLQASSDGVLLLENQQLHQVCSQLLHMKEVSLADINKVISHSLASALQPAVPFDAHLSGLHTQLQEDKEPLAFSRCRLGDVISLLCPHQQYKFLSLKSIPQMPDTSHAYSRFLWAGLLKHLRQMLLTDSPTEEGMDWSVMPAETMKSGCGFHRGINRSIANLLILRGNELESVNRDALLEPRLYSSHTPSSCICSVWCSNHMFNNYEKCCTLLSNSQSCVRPLEQICRKSWNMFTARAFVHQYQKYGFTEDNFINSFVAVEQLLSHYRTIT